MRGQRSRQGYTNIYICTSMRVGTCSTAVLHPQTVCLAGAACIRSTRPCTHTGDATCCTTLRPGFAAPHGARAYSSFRRRTTSTHAARGHTPARSVHAWDPGHQQACLQIYRRACRPVCTHTLYTYVVNSSHLKIIRTLAQAHCPSYHRIPIFRKILQLVTQYKLYKSGRLSPVHTQGTS